eukprot:CAMPEP_0184479940 /NCGR_PEP_ID=MMETSP0113_2-20130426/1463_1 /TAXON_ID=91329 /ORGANISM="Norrisiella sphaerica, Strain BC52" /LENGTH=447 /DNA_ID=CAMNT_0026858117 /DNA_START=379 /DNA_END=1722 /DNA_ORIENTATION=+
MASPTTNTRQRTQVKGGALSLLSTYTPSLKLSLAPERTFLTRVMRPMGCMSDRFRRKRRGNFHTKAVTEEGEKLQESKQAVLPGSEKKGKQQLGEATDWDAKYRKLRGKIKYGAWKAQGLRDEMEDNFDIIDKGRCGFLYASVFDGHGGRAASEYLKQHLYGVFSEEISQVQGEAAPMDSDRLTMVDIEDSLEDLEENLSMELPKEVVGLSCPIPLTRVLTRMFEETDKKLLEHLSTIDDIDQSRSGSTATVALVRKDRLIIANVGDSRAVLGRGENALDLSKEHRAYGDTDITWNEIERIEQVGAWVDDGRVLDILGITRAFGDPDFKGEGLSELKKTCVDMGYWTQELADSLEFSGDPIIVTPDVTEIQVTKQDDLLLVASDGLWDVYDSGEAIGTARMLLNRGESMEGVAKALCERAIQYGSEDNVAVVAIDLRGLHYDEADES